MTKEIRSPKSEGRGAASVLGEAVARGGNLVVSRKCSPSLWIAVGPPGFGVRQSSGALTRGVSRSTGKLLPLALVTSAAKAPEDWRTPRRWRADADPSVQCARFFFGEFSPQPSPAGRGRIAAGLPANPQRVRNSPSWLPPLPLPAGEDWDESPPKLSRIQPLNFQRTSNIEHRTSNAEVNRSWRDHSMFGVPCSMFNVFRAYDEGERHLEPAAPHHHPDLRVSQPTIHPTA